MADRIILISLFLFPISVFSQVNYESGYYIDNEGVRNSCLLISEGLDVKGEDYIFKLQKREEPQNFNIEEVKEFGIEGSLKFVREFIEVDVSSNQINSSKDIQDHVELERGHAFLLQLIGSEQASLYYFFFGGYEYFFYAVGNSGINHLVHKQFYHKIAHSVEVLKDNRYQEQLAIELPCSMNSKTLSYTRRSLVEYLETYIEENGGEISVFNKKTKSLFNIKIAATFNQSSFYIEDGGNSGFGSGIDFGMQKSFSCGAELEYLFSFNRNMLGLFSEVNYTKYQAVYSNNTTSIESVSVIDYEFIELPVGLIYSFNLSDKSKLFFKAGAVPNIVFDGSSISFYVPSNNYKLRSSTNMFLGAGISYRIFSAEARIYSRRNITKHLFKRDSHYEQFSIRIACNLNFRKQAAW